MDSSKPMTRRERRERERALEASGRARNLHREAVTNNVVSSPSTLTDTDPSTNTSQPMSRRERWAALRNQNGIESAENVDKSQYLSHRTESPAPTPVEDHHFATGDSTSPVVEPATAGSPAEDIDPEIVTSQPSNYAPEQNVDLGDLEPLPGDQREYPQLDTEHVPEPVAVEEEVPAGYLEVAPGGLFSPADVDEEALEIRRKKKRRRVITLVASFVLVVVALVGVGLGAKTLFPSATPDFEGPGHGEVIFTVNPGEGPIVIGNRLVEENVVASTKLFQKAVENAETDREIQPGEYQLKKEMPAQDAADTLLRVGEAANHYVPVNSGRRISEVFEDISVATEYSVEEIEDAAQDPTQYGLPEQAPSLEGYIAVGEYRFPVDATPEEILEQMIEPTLEELEKMGITDPSEQFRTVTIASILEAEALPDDRRVVAGIIENRLKQDNSETAGFLQIDATVIYGMGVRQLQFTDADRKDKSNKYNTYAHKGLPPGPIGAPSLKSIDAAADPEDTDNYYWITTNIETGETKFAKTLEQHRKYQDEYRQYCADNPEICGIGDQGTVGDGPGESDD